MIGRTMAHVKVLAQIADDFLDQRLVVAADEAIVHPYGNRHEFFLVMTKVEARIRITRA
jgi:hypothetical protein